MLLRQGPLEVTLTPLACLLCTLCSVHDATVLPSGLNQVAAEDVRNSGKQVLLAHDLSTQGAVATDARAECTFAAL